MRHQKAGRKLKRTSSHRKATLAALCTSLILHKKIKTTVAKAKETRMFVEKVITRAKNAVAKETDTSAKNVAARREVYAFLRNRPAVVALFKDIAPKVSSRPGGYTRVIKLGRRLGDAAELAVLELVDFNLAQEKAVPKTKKKTTSKKKDASKVKKDQSETTVSESDEQKVSEENPKTEESPTQQSNLKKNAIKKDSK